MTRLISVNIDALNDDSKAWGCVSDQLNRAGEALKDVDAPSSVFRCVASAQEVADRYATILNNLADALSTGAKQAALGSEVLTEIAEDFRANELAAVEEYEKLWAPHGS